MQNFKFGGVTVLAVQLFNKIKRKKKKDKKTKKKDKKTKNMTCFTVFPDIMSKFIYFLSIYSFCMF